MSAYDKDDLQSVLTYMRERFGVGIFEEPPRMYAIMNDLSPKMKSARNILRQLSEAGLCAELSAAIKSGKDTERSRVLMKSKYWLKENLDLSDERAEYYVTALNTVYALETEPPKPQPISDTETANLTLLLEKTETRAIQQKDPLAWVLSQALRKSLERQGIETPKPQTAPPELIPQPRPTPSKPKSTPQPTLPKLSPIPQSELPLQPQTNSIKSGYTGDCTWVLERDGVLTISGKGNMSDYSDNSNKPPWRVYAIRIHTVIIEDGVTSIGAYAFASCISLSNVRISNSVISIGEYAFAWCRKLDLSNVHIPDNVINIGHCAFRDCRNSTNVNSKPIVIDSGHYGVVTWELNSNGLLTINNQTYYAGPMWDFSFSYIYGRGKSPWGKYSKLIHSVSVGFRVTSIGKNAFAGCKNLTKVSLFPTLERIEDWAFNACENLVSMDIPNSVTSIGTWAFGNCKKLQSVNIPCSVRSIGAFAFSDCDSLSSVNVPKSTRIALGAFDKHTKVTRY